MTQEENGSFPTGFVVGFLSGAVAYFLTQTQEGQELKEEFINHWYELKDSLVEEGILSEAQSEITDYIRVIRTKISDFLGEDLELMNSKKSASKKPTKRSRKKKLFKGI